MSLTAADIAEIMRLVEQSSFDELTLEMDGIKLCLRRGGAAAPNGASPPSQLQTQVETTTQSAAASALSGAATTEPKKVEVAPPDPSSQDVLSPLLGTFYRAPKPGAPPFVEVGSEVQEDTVVAIVEVMKLMNTVRAGVRGTVTEIFVADGTLVEYGQPLLRVRKST